MFRFHFSVNRLVLFTWSVKVISLYSKIIKRLLCSGDIDMNPGPTVNFKKLSQEFLKAPKDTKFFHINCQSIVQKKEQMQIILSGLGDNTVYGLSETWLKESNDHKLWDYVINKLISSSLAKFLKRSICRKQNQNRRSSKKGIMHL